MHTAEITTTRYRRPEEVPAPRRSHPVASTLGLSVGGLLAVYLVARGVLESFTVHYSDPASYRDDWGGPSLAGVFAVHSGPAVLIVTGTVIYLRRRWRNV